MAVPSKMAVTPSSLLNNSPCYCLPCEGRSERKARERIGHKMKCECNEVGQLRSEIAHMYDSVTELPFVRHEPGECRCENDLKQYSRAGKVVWLCSCCWTSKDTLSEGQESGVQS